MMSKITPPYDTTATSFTKVKSSTVSNKSNEPLIPIGAITEDQNQSAVDIQGFKPSEMIKSGTLIAGKLRQTSTLHGDYSHTVYTNSVECEVAEQLFDKLKDSLGTVSKESITEALEGGDFTLAAPNNGSQYSEKMVKEQLEFLNRAVSKYGTAGKLSIVGLQKAYKAEDHSTLSTEASQKTLRQYNYGLGAATRWEY